MWQLVICAGITWAGCGTASYSLYPSEDSCYRALKALRIADQPVAESDKKRSMFAYCRPNEVNIKESK